MQTVAERPQVPFASLLGPLVIAHRGGSLETPENTLAGIQRAVDVGADWVEIDVRLSADDQPFVIHDRTLDRTTDSSGDVSAKRGEALRLIANGNPTWSSGARARLAKQGVDVPVFGDRYSEERIASLEQALAIKGIRFMLELKEVPSTQANVFVQKVAEIIYRSNAADRVAIASSETAILWAAYNRDPSIPLIGIVEDTEALSPMLNLPIRVLAVDIPLVPEALRLSPPQLAVWAWTAYTVDSVKSVIESGVHGVISDIPEATVKALRPEPGIYVETSQP